MTIGYSQEIAFHVIFEEVQEFLGVSFGETSSNFYNTGPYNL